MYDKHRLIINKPLNEYILKTMLSTILNIKHIFKQLNITI